MKIGIVGLLVLGSLSCANESPIPQAEHGPEKIMEVKELKASEADSLFELVLGNHGGSKYDSAHFSFIFRKTEYTFENQGSDYFYSRKFVKAGDSIFDFMSPNSFSREVNWQFLELAEKELIKYRSSLNSVIYFATLPHKLGDASVHKKIVGEDSVNGLSYILMEVGFEKTGGGEDFDDEYLYWINSESLTMDYFAYNYQVNGGGVRFRSSFNRRKVDGILFQDYINFEAPIGTPLKDLANMMENGDLKELSRILTEDVKSIKENQKASPIKK